MVARYGYVQEGKIMEDERTLLEDLEAMGDDLYSAMSEPGWAGTAVLALVVLIVTWLWVCTAAAYIGD